MNELANFAFKLRNQFGPMLGYYLAQIKHQIPIKPKILDVACGYCLEFESLSTFFGEDITGIDLDEKAIENVKKRIDTRAKFFIGDARNLTQLVNQDFDIVIARQPHIDQDDWKTIYEQCYKVTKPAGLLFSTYTSIAEHQTAEKLIRQTGYEISLSGENKREFKCLTEESDLLTIGFDVYITLAKKGTKKHLLARLFR